MKKTIFITSLFMIGLFSCSEDAIVPDENLEPHNPETETAITFEIQGQNDEEIED